MALASHGSKFDQCILKPRRRTLCIQLLLHCYQQLFPVQYDSPIKTWEQNSNIQLWHSHLFLTGTMSEVKYDTISTQTLNHGKPSSILEHMSNPARLHFTAPSQTQNSAEIRQTDLSIRQEQRPIIFAKGSTNEN